jgi:uncharacterized membrane protein
VVWENGMAIDLGWQPGDEDSNATAINELGVIVGATGRTEPEIYELFYRPFIYENGVMTAISTPSQESPRSMWKTMSSNPMPLLPDEVFTAISVQRVLVRHTLASTPVCPPVCPNAVRRPSSGSQRQPRSQ